MMKKQPTYDFQMTVKKEGKNERNHSRNDKKRKKR